MTGTPTAYNRKGTSVCRNNSMIPMPGADDTILTLLGKHLLDPDVIREAIDRTRALVAGRGQSVEMRRRKLTAAITEIDAELSRLTAAIAAGAEVASVVAAIKEREGNRQALTGELKALDGQQAVAGLDMRAIDRKIDAALRDWRQTIRKHVPQARQMARKLLRDRITFTPQTDDLGRAGWRYHAEGSVSKLLLGVLPEFPQAVASPTGFEPVF